MGGAERAAWAASRTVSAASNPFLMASFRVRAQRPATWERSVEMLPQAILRKPANRFFPSGLPAMPVGPTAESGMREEGGCTGPDPLDHLRCSGPPVRGCRAVDRLLARE